MSAKLNGEQIAVIRPEHFDLGNKGARMRCLFLIFFCLTCAGCAVNTVYEPVAAANRQTVLLNESSLDRVKNGMTQDQVHAILGQELIIGYSRNRNKVKLPFEKPPATVETPKRRFRVYEWGSIRVAARNKSEARSLIKKQMKVERLPVGAELVDVTGK